MSDRVIFPAGGEPIVESRKPFHLTHPCDLHDTIAGS
jgi:hypothetical protein